MVSKNLIIVLITVAILLSAVSIIVTVSSLNNNLVPDAPHVQTQTGDVYPDYDKGQVGIIVNRNS